MRVLHLGNVANNGYINAKFLRRSGLAADAVCDERHIISQPEWEEADVDAPDDHYSSLEDQARAHGWERPDWVVPVFDPFQRRVFKGQYRLQYLGELTRRTPELRRLYRRLSREYEPLRPELGDLQFSDVVAGFRRGWLHRLLLRQPLRPLFRRYDVVQAYATHPIFTMINTPDQPYVAFEHGTLRDIPFEDSYVGRLMSLAYLRAGRVIITNSDVISSVRRLGLENYVFVPHPIDETKYRAGPSTIGDELRAGGADFVLLSPSRHDWLEKGNDLVLRAVAELVRRDRPAAVLLLTEWGTQVDDSKRLIDELGIGRNVRWLPPLAKVRLLDAYRAADVVLDQFLIGTFGGIAPEAMACGKPVVMAFDVDVHRWCFPELPPIASARTESEIYAHLSRLARDAEERERVGREGRAWVEKYYSSGIVVERHREIYDAILDGAPAAARAPSP